MIRFFDDQPLEAIENMSRHYEHPKLVWDATYIDPSGWPLCGGLPSVFRHDERKEYIMIYTVLEPDDSIYIYQCAAHSSDALRWEPLDTRGIA